MSGRQSFPLHPALRLVSGPAIEPHTPRQNRLLAALPQEDCQRLLPKLESVPMPLGWAAHGAGDQQKHVYFPTAGIVALVNAMPDGATVECAITGSEGMIGITSFLGGACTSHQTLVLSAGYAYRLPMTFLKDETKHDGALMHILLSHLQALMVQIGQNVACNRYHSVEQRLCRWLLECLDRSPTSELMMTHELIANALGVRRESIAGAAGNLRDMGVIRYTRGRIDVLDRHRLEAQACECYAVVKREYVQLLPAEELEAKRVGKA